MHKPEPSQAARAALLALAIGTPRLSAQDCQPYWAAMDFPMQFDHASRVVAFDDGSGPALFASWGYALGLLRWRNGSWSSAAAGLPPLNTVVIGDFVILDDGSGPALYLPGKTFTPPQQYTYWLARWNGASWDMVWPGMATSTSLPQISADVGEGLRIYGFTLRPPDGFVPARWDADHWTVLGGDISGGSILGFAAYDDGTGPALYVTGVDRVEGVPAGGFARWNGRWQILGDSTYVADTKQLVVLGSGPDARLFQNGGVAVNGSYLPGIAMWDGRHWTNAGGSTGGAIIDLHLFDDGRGTALYVAGSFLDFGGVITRSIARFNGQTWEGLGVGFVGAGGQVEHLASMPGPRGNTLFAFGYFDHAGAGLTYRAAQWIGCPNCYANCDLSTISPTLNVNDFVCFLQKFAARAPEANCDVNATIDVNDFVCFLTKFAAGCP